MFSQGSALILCLGQGLEVKVSEGGAVPNPCQALASVSRHSRVCERGIHRAWLSLLMENHTCFAWFFFFSPFPYPQPSQAAEEGVIKNQVC